MAELPVLKGHVTKDMVKKIGSGSYAAEYIPWSKIAELMQVHAPGWMPSCITADDGSLLHKAPVGAYLMIQFVHLDGTETPAYPQAVQDNRHKSIPYEKITSRDITDTQRRGWCLAAAAVFGIGVEMWTRDPLESGYGASDSAPESAPKAAPTATPKKEATEASFREAALEKGVHTVAIDAIVKKLDGKWEAGLATLGKKTADELNKAYGPKGEASSDEQW